MQILSTKAPAGLNSESWDINLTVLRTHGVAEYLVLVWLQGAPKSFLKPKGIFLSK